MKRRNCILLCLGCLLVGCIALLPLSSSETAVAAPGGGSGFSEQSLNGSYASSGRAGGFLSRSVGVTTFDGKGGVERFVSINASDGADGRRIILLTSIGTYTVNASGLGEVRLVNQFVDGRTNEVTYDIVISESSRGGAQGYLLADAINGIQREAGVTASLVEEAWTRREGL